MSLPNWDTVSYPFFSGNSRSHPPHLALTSPSPRSLFPLNTTPSPNHPFLQRLIFDYSDFLFWNFLTRFRVCIPVLFVCSSTNSLSSSNTCISPLAKTSHLSDTKEHASSFVFIVATGTQNQLRLIGCRLLFSLVSRLKLCTGRSFSVFTHLGVFVIIFIRDTCLLSFSRRLVGDHSPFVAITTCVSFPEASLHHFLHHFQHYPCIHTLA